MKIEKSDYINNSEKETNEIIAKSLRQLWEQLENKRKEENKTLTYEELSNFVGITPQAFKSYLGGQKSPKSNKIPKLKEFFNTSYERIFGETESDNKNNIVIREDLGLSDKAITNLVQIKQQADKQLEEWGEDSQQPQSPNMYLFAINKLLENKEILYLIGDFLSNPCIDNQYLDMDIKEKLSNKQIYIPDDDYFSYKIMKMLEQLHNKVGNTKEVSSFTYDKLNMSKYYAEERKEQEKYFDKLDEEI